jgi:hypothetical protein
MTVPPLFGWQHVLTALVVVVIVAVAGLVALVFGSSPRQRAEWLTELEERSVRRRNQ